MKIAPVLVGTMLVASLTACASADKATSDTSATDAVAQQTAEAEAPATDPIVEEVQPEPTEAPKPKTTNMAVGETITVETTEMSMQVQAVSAKLSTTPPDEYTEPPVGKWLGILIQYNCVTGSCDYNPYDFVLRGSDGAEYDTASVYGDPQFEPDLNSGTLSAGVPAKGYVVYDVPAGTYSLEYRASLWDEQAASWTIPVA